MAAMPYAKGHGFTVTQPFAMVIRGTDGLKCMPKIWVVSTKVIFYHFMTLYKTSKIFQNVPEDLPYKIHASSSAALISVILVPEEYCQVVNIISSYQLTLTYLETLVGHNVGQILPH